MNLHQFVSSLIVALVQVGLVLLELTNFLVPVQVKHLVNHSFLGVVHKLLFFFQLNNLSLKSLDVFFGGLEFGFYFLKLLLSFLLNFLGFLIKFGELSFIDGISFFLFCNVIFQASDLLFKKLDFFELSGVITSLIF